MNNFDLIKVDNSWWVDNSSAMEALNAFSSCVLVAKKNSLSLLLLKMLEGVVLSTSIAATTWMFRTV